MKKFIAMAFCFALAVSILTACGSENNKTTDTTTTPSSIATEPTTKTTAPTTTEPTQASTIPDSGSMPNNGDTGTGSSNGGNSGTGSANGGNGGSGNTNGGTGNGMGGSMDNGTAQSRAHYPSVIGGSR